MTPASQLRLAGVGAASSASLLSLSRMSNSLHGIPRAPLAFTACTYHVFHWCCPLRAEEQSQVPGY